MKKAVKISLTIIGKKLDDKAREIIEYVADKYELYSAHYEKVEVSSHKNDEGK